MRCGECGVESAASARFCPHCGAPAASVGGVDGSAAGTAGLPELPVRRAPKWLVVAVTVAVVLSSAAVIVVQRGDADGSPTVAASPHAGSALGVVRWNSAVYVEPGWWWSPVVALGGTLIASHSGALVAIEPASGEVQWRRPVDAFPWGRSSGFPVAVGDHLLLVTDRPTGGFSVRALDPATGRDRWTREEDSASAGLVAGERAAYLQIWRWDPEQPDGPGTSELGRLDPATGDLVWRRAVDPGWTAAASDDVIVSLRDQPSRVEPTGEVQASVFEATVLDGRTGEELWRRPLGGIHHEGEPTKQHPLAAVGGDVVVLADVTGHLVAHDARTGAQVWEAPAGREHIEVVDDLLLARDDRSHVVAYDLATGAPRWESEDRFLGGPLLDIVADDLLLVPYGGSRLTAVDLRDGTTRWVVEAQAGQTGVIVDGAFVTMSETTGSAGSPGIPRLQAFEVSTGDLRWSLPLPSRADLRPLEAGGLVGVVEGSRVRFRDPITGRVRDFPTLNGAILSAVEGPGGAAIVTWWDEQGRAMLSAVDADEVRWDVRITDPTEGRGWTPLLGPATTRGLVAVGRERSLLTYNVDLGRPVGAIEMAQRVAHVVATRQGFLVTTADGAVALVGPGDDVPRWSIAFDANVGTAPAPAAGVAYLAAAASEVRAIDLENGTLRWRRDLGAPVSEPPVAAGDRVLAVVGQNVVALDGRTGEPRWERRFSSPLAGPPAAVGDEVRAAFTDGTVLSLDAATGDTRAQLILGDAIAGGPWVIGDTTYVAVASSGGRTDLVAIGPLPEAAATVTPPPILDRP